MAIAVLMGGTTSGSANFDPTRWDHWLLVSCFVGMAIWSIWLSWRWERRGQKMRRRARMSRLVTMAQYRSGFGSGVTDEASSATASEVRALRLLEPSSPEKIRRRY